MNVVDIMAQPRKAMKSLGFQGCCLRCDAVDKSGLLRCKICIDYHKKIKNIIIGNDDSVLIQHMRELYSMLSKPEMFDNDEIHGEELTYQQSLIGSVSFDGGYVYPEDISELYNKSESQSKRLLQDLGSKNVWKNNPPSNEIAKMIGDETWTDEETGDDYFEYFCQINGGQRTGKISEIIMNPTARMLGKLQDCRKDVAEAMKGKF